MLNAVNANHKKSFRPRKPQKHENFKRDYQSVGHHRKGWSAK